MNDCDILPQEDEKCIWWTFTFFKIVTHAKNELYPLANFRWRSVKKFYVKMEAEGVLLGQNVSKYSGHVTEVS